MRDIFFLLMSLGYLTLGLRAPFVFGLGYLWIDFMDPQGVSFGFFATIPMSFVMGVAAFAGFLLLAPKKDGPRATLPLLLFPIWAVWMTITTTWAVVPAAAWDKWDWAFKVACFAGLIPFLFRKRNHLEALLLTLSFSIAAITMAGAVKTLIHGGGYGLALGLQRGNSGLTEGSTLACVAIATIPILIYMHDHSKLFSSRTLSFYFFYGLSAANIITCIGTFERTGLVSIAVLGCLILFRTKRKLAYLAAVAVVVFASSLVISERYLSRMDTINSYQSDQSAMVRIKVWEWTLQYVAQHPLGGGFVVYAINRIVLPPDDKSDGQPVVQHGRAFHSLWFEVLGSQGIPGMAIFLLMIASFYRNTYRIFRIYRTNRDLQWASSLAWSLMASVTIYLAGGSFVGIAFQPFLYDILAAAIVLNECARKSEPDLQSPIRAFGPSTARKLISKAPT